MKLYIRSVSAIFTFLGVIILWQSVVTFGLVNSILFPPPTQVFQAFIEMLNSGELIEDSFISLARAFFGFIIGAFFGIFLGLLTSKVEVLSLPFSQLMHFLRNIPPIALVPLAIIWFGVGELSKIFLIFWSVLFPVWINTHVGITEIQKEFLWLAKLFELNKVQTFKEVILPASMPFIITGLRIGTGMAFIALIAAELAASTAGIGFRISISHLVFRIDKMLVGILLLGFFGFLADRIFVLISNKIAIKWRKEYGQND